MKCRSDSSDGNDPRTPVAAGGGGSNEPAKKQWTEPPFSSSHAEASSSSSHAPPPQQQQPPPDAREVGEPPRVPDLGEDLVFEVLRRAEARTLAAAACVSRGWRQLAEDEWLWEAACVREWANLGFSEQQLRAVVLSLGGFRRLHAVYIRPLQLQRQRRGAGASLCQYHFIDSPSYKFGLRAYIMEERSVLMERYEIGRQLGQGTFAKVYYARNLTTGQSVAIKMIDKEKVLRVGLMEQIKREISIMRLVRHPNILQLFEVMATKSKIYFVLEYAKGGELFNKIAKGKLSEDAARKYFQQLISAVDYCHSRGVYHRDLKPENLLLDENETLRVSDFGLSALAESKRQDGLLHTACGTPAYVAPEVLSRKGYSGAKADVWSCGVILFVLAAGYLPFHDRNLIEMYRKISKAEYRCPRYFSAELKELLYGILDPDPCTRMSISRIKRSAWYRKPIEITALKTETRDKTCTGDATTSGLTGCIGSERNQGSLRLTNLNAFDIISLSTGFDLSGLFDERYGRREARFTSRQPAATVFVKLKELAKRLKLKVTKKDNGVLKLATVKEGKKGILELDAEIFEVATSFLLVELKKTNGDTLEYQKLMKEDIRPSLKDIVWAWQGDHQQSQLLRHAEEQQPPPLSPCPPHQTQD